MTTPTTTPTDDESPEAMEALFNELSQARASGTELPSAPSEKSEPEEKAEAAAPAPAPASNPAIEAPIAPAESAAAPAPVSAPAPAPAAPPLDLSKLDQPTRDYLAKIDNERRAAIGRAAALQREQDAAKRRQAAQPAPAPASAADDPTAKLAAEFPELAAALDAKVAQSERAFAEQLQKTAFRAKADALDALFPGWLEKMQSAEFNYWLTQQDEPTQKLFESDNTRDYAVLLRSYEVASAPTDAPPAAPSDVTRIKQQREARLARTHDVPSTKTAPNPTGEPDAEADPEAAFNWRSQQREKARLRQQNQ